MCSSTTRSTKHSNFHFSLAIARLTTSSDNLQQVQLLHEDEENPPSSLRRAAHGILQPQMLLDAAPPAGWCGTRSSNDWHVGVPWNARCGAWDGACVCVRRIARNCMCMCVCVCVRVRPQTCARRGARLFARFLCVYTIFLWNISIYIYILYAHASKQPLAQPAQILKGRPKAAAPQGDVAGLVHDDGGQVLSSARAAQALPATARLDAFMAQGPKWGKPMDVCFYQGYEAFSRHGT